jgi:hypothetical protein
MAPWEMPRGGIMDKPTRPLGITALAFASVITGIFCQVAAIALLMGGTLIGVVGTNAAAGLLIVGALYLGLMVAAYLVGYGFWSQRHWSWAGGLVVYATLIFVSAVMVLLSANILSVVVPAAGAAVVIWYLLRPRTRAQLLGTDADATRSTGSETTVASGSSTIEAPQTAR